MENLEITPIWKAPLIPALLFRWQRFPLSLVAFEWTDADAMPTLKFYAYCLRLGVPYRKLVCVPVSKRHYKGMDFHQLICNPKQGEKFYRLAHWRMVAWSLRDPSVTS